MLLHRILIFTVSLLAFTQLVQGQSVRDRIDYRRLEVDLESEEAYEAAQEFLRLDSTYYIGWLYLGSYLHQRAADRSGYSKCVIPLLKAKELIESDYNKELNNRTTSEEVFFSNFNLYQDYNFIAYFLSSSYSVMDQPDSSYWIASEYQKHDFQKDLSYYNGPFLSKAWTVYRHRAFSSSDHKFLKSDLKNNMSYVHELMDSSYSRIERNIELNNQALPYFSNSSDLASYYYFNSIIQAYDKKYDQAEKSYESMEKYGIFSHNNYALLKMSQGLFSEAYDNFDFERELDPYQKVLEEWIYYQGILNTYSNNNKESIQLITDWINKVGSTPGYGWYNIALARSYLFQGDLDNATKSLQKAKNFTEYHIGTTLGEEGYEQAIDFLDVMLTSYKLEAIKFENPKWYLSFSTIGKYIKQRWELLLKRWKLLNKIAGFEDREKLIYDLFSGESTSGWYETLYTLKTYSVGFFIEYYQKLLRQEDTPQGLVSFYSFALSLLQSEGGYKQKSISSLEHSQSVITNSTETLSLLEFLQLEQKANLGKVKNLTASQQMFTLYPSLLPYTNRTMSFELKISGKTTELVEKCIKRMKKCRIDFVRTEGQFPLVTLTPLVQGEDEFMVVDVSLNGEKIIDTYKLSIMSEDDGVKLAYALFDIYGRKKTIQ